MLPSSHAAVRAALVGACLVACLAGAPSPAAACPSGQPPAPSAPSAPGSPATPACAGPAPLVGPAIAPEHTVGGPQLARTGVVLDAPATVPPPPEVSDVSYVVADLGTGAVLAAKSPHALLLPASTLKTLTALVLLPALDPAAVVTATDAQVAAEGTRVGMIANNPYTVDQLFHGLVLVSGNDTAYALADAFGGRARTLAAMNARAAQLGAWDTVAMDPSGLDAPGQRSSAYDLALLGRAVMQLPAFRGYAVTKDFVFPGGTDRTGRVYPPFHIANHNLLLANYPGTIGVKNGYTTGAQHTFIGAATRGGRTLLVTEMGGTVVPSWKPAAALLDWAFANADQVRPVGRLVDAGAPQPPEWRGEGSGQPAGTGSPSPGAGSGAPGVGATPPVLAGGPGGGAGGPGGGDPSGAGGAGGAAGAGHTAGGGNPLPGLVSAASTAVNTAANTARSTVAEHPAAYAVLLALAAVLGGWSLARRRRS